MMHQNNRRRSRAIAALTAALLLLGGARAGASSAAPPDAHATPACDTCHLRAGPKDAAGDPGGGAALLVPNERCLRCHDGRAPADGLAVLFHDGGRRACVDCHSFHHPDELKAGTKRFAHVFGEAGAARHCAACHGGRGGVRGLGQGHRDAAAVYHGADEDLKRLSPSEACLLCHSRTAADAAALSATTEPPRFHEHASHPYGAEVTPGRVSGGFRIRRDIDPRLPLFDGRMECVTCHDITDDVPDLLVRVDEPGGLCTACHQRLGDERAVVAAAEPRRGSGERAFGLSD